MSFARAVPIALLLALAAPAAALADATLSVTGAAPNKTLTFTVNDGLGDHLGATADDHLVIDDSRAVPVGGSGCTAIEGGRRNEDFKVRYGMSPLDLFSCVLPCSAI